MGLFEGSDHYIFSGGVYMVGRSIAIIGGVFAGLFMSLFVYNAGAPIGDIIIVWVIAGLLFWFGSYLGKQNYDKWKDENRPW